MGEVKRTWEFFWLLKAVTAAEKIEIKNQQSLFFDLSRVSDPIYSRIKAYINEKILTNHDWFLNPNMKD